MRLRTCVEKGQQVLLLRRRVVTHFVNVSQGDLSWTRGEAKYVLDGLEAGWAAVGPCYGSTRLCPQMDGVKGNCQGEAVVAGWERRRPQRDDVGLANQRTSFTVSCEKDPLDAVANSRGLVGGDVPRREGRA